MVQNAIKEGKSSEKPKEHPISIIQQIHMQKEDIQKAQEKIKELENKFNDNYTDDEKSNAQIEFNKMLKTTLEKIEEENEENEENEQFSEVNTILERIKDLELEREKDISSEEIERLDLQINLLKEKLKDQDVINNYINVKYENPQIKLV